MKYAVLAAALLLAFVAEIPSANAVICARGVARAGCAGAHGAVVVGRPAVVPHCVIRAGVRVCR